MKTRTSRDWIPFWTDKWIFGSMRIEFNVEERGIWIDLLALANKDEGWIRANEETPYPMEQLSGMLMIEKFKLEKAIEKFVKRGKVTRSKNGAIYITNWEKYSFTDRHKRRVMSENGDGQSKNRTLEKRREEKKRGEESREEKIIEEFEEFWSAYRDIKNKKDDIGDKKEALKAYKALRKKEEVKTIIKATNGYADFLKCKRLEENFKQRKMYASTFLRSEKWRRYIDFEYKGSL